MNAEDFPLIEIGGKKNISDKDGWAFGVEVFLDGKELPGVRKAIAIYAEEEWGRVVLIIDGRIKTNPARCSTEIKEENACHELHESL